MNSRGKFSPLTIGGLAAAALALCVAWGVSHRADASDPKGAKAPGVAAAASSPVSVIAGVTVIEVSLAGQKSGGFVVQPLTAAAAPTGARSYGVAMDLQPLAEWRTKVVAAAAQARAARTQAATSTADLARTRALHDDDRNASLKSLQAAQAAADETKGGEQAAQAALEGLRQQGAMQFGARVIDDVLRDDHSALLSGQRALLRVAMAADAAAPATASVACGGPQLPARWMATAPQADAQLGAPVQLYLVDHAVPANASCIVTFPAMTPTSQGVQVPLDAVVWFADQPWVYVQRDATHFARTALAGATELPQGFFAPEGLRAGDKVVTRGAGMLLSVEQAPPSAGGAGCKDPECDD